MKSSVNVIWKILGKLIPILDFVLTPFTLLAAIWFFLIRKCGIERCFFSKKIFLSVGVFPIRDHYYEPLFNSGEINKKGGIRHLPGIDINTDEQLSVLSQFNFLTELKSIPFDSNGEVRFYYNNPSFFAGDAEYLYSMIRVKKPRKIIEIGSGFSTLMTLEAIRKNKSENTNYDCSVTCIEPYEMPWLEQTGVNVIRKKVEDVELSLFSNLGENDILFIDSSHIIRPDGDVLFEYLEILPMLKSGVIVHIHDIYTPYDYPIENYEKYVVFINEQYLVEALLTMNKSFRVIGALHYLKNNFPEALNAKFPIFAEHGKREPRSFWIVKN